MSWNYRIVRYRNNKGFGLHEVYYNKDGEPWGMTKRPAGFACNAVEGPQEIISVLAVAHTDAMLRPVFDEPRKWPGKAP